MKHFVLLLLSIAIVSCAKTAPPNYKGADAGVVVLGFGATSKITFNDRTLFFRRLEEASQKTTDYQRGYFSFCRRDWAFCHVKPDYDSPSEKGIVLAVFLPPGKYEIYNFDLFFNGGTIQKRLSSREPFSIPFTVKPDRVVYLGNYQANEIIGENIFGLPVMAAGGFFMVENRINKDIAIARKKTASLPLDIDIAVPSVKEIASPFFVAKQ